jgi:hypothetical protein
MRASLASLDLITTNARNVEAQSDLARVGATFQAQFTSSWEGPGRVDACDAANHLVSRWSPGLTEAVIEALLTAEGERTRLAVEERGLPLDVGAHVRGTWAVTAP